MRAHGREPTGATREASQTSSSTGTPRHAVAVKKVLVALVKQVVALLLIKVMQVVGAVGLQIIFIQVAVAVGLDK